MAINGWRWLNRFQSIFHNTSPRKRRHARPRLEALEDRFVLSPVTTVADSGTGSLRQAIIDANNNVDTTITFNIAPGGHQTIHLLSALPALTNPTTLDATTQTGFSSAPLIELDGTSAGATTDGLTVTGGTSIIRGLIINNFSGTGLVVSTNGGNTIQGNYLGTDHTGAAALGNGLDGLDVVNCSNNLIGGTNLGEGNLISGNNVSGLYLSNSSNDSVFGNLIGTDATGTQYLGNGADGIELDSGANNNQIGLPLAGSGLGNTIAFNGGSGIFVPTGDSGDTIRGNAIFDNYSQGINDDDAGADPAQPYPVLDSAIAQIGTTTIWGTLNSTASTLFTLDFYATDAAHGHGFAQGQFYLGSQTALTTPSGNATFIVSLNAVLPGGQWITATATDASGNTSQFSYKIQMDYTPQHAIAATGSDAGVPDVVRVFDLDTNQEVFHFTPYPNFSGGVRVAMADLNGDGVPEVITAPGPGLPGGAMVKIFNGAFLLGQVVSPIGPGVLPLFGATPASELWLAAGDFNGDTIPDLVVGNFSATGGPGVVILDGLAAQSGMATALGPINTPFGVKYKGGVRVAVGDVNGDGTLDVIAGQSQKGATVKAFSGASLTLLTSLVAAKTPPAGGVFVSAGNVDDNVLGDEIVVGLGAGGASKVLVYKDNSALDTKAVLLAKGAAFASTFKGGVRVATADLDGDGIASILVAPGAGIERRVRVLGRIGASLLFRDEFNAEAFGYKAGLFIAGARLG